MKTVPSIPMYKQIYSKIKADIESGALNPGDKIHTELELAAVFNVSRITATRAMKDLESDGYIHRARKSGSFVSGDYIKKANEKPSVIIPIVQPYNKNIDFNIIYGAQDEALKNNAVIAFYCSEQNIANERSIIKKILGLNPSGLIVYPCSGFENLDIFCEIINKKIPLVFLDRSVQGLNVPCVTSDNKKAMSEIVSHIISKGHKKIAYVCGSLSKIQPDAERFNGYISALMNAEIIPDPKYIFTTILNENLYTMSMEEQESYFHSRLEQILCLLLDMPDRPTAVAFENDASAMEFIEIAAARGVKIPEDFSVTGFDDLPAAGNLSVPLTTVMQDFRQMGAFSVRLIIDMLGKNEVENKTYYFDTKYIERKSLILSHS